MKISGAPSDLSDYPVPGTLDDPRFRWMYEYWRGRAQGAALPGRGDVDPVDFPRLLGQVNLIEVVREDAAPRFRYRLWGSLVTEIIGRDYTGRFLDEIEESQDSLETQQVLQQVVRSRRPHFWQRAVPKHHRRFRSYRRLLLPLAEDGRSVDMLLALMIGDLAARHALQPAAEAPRQQAGADGADGVEKAGAERDEEAGSNIEGAAGARRPEDLRGRD